MARKVKTLFSNSTSTPSNLGNTTAVSSTTTPNYPGQGQFGPNTYIPNWYPNAGSGGNAQPDWYSLWIQTQKQMQDLVNENKALQEKCEALLERMEIIEEDFEDFRSG